jgi:hypothetical protein
VINKLGVLVDSKMTFVDHIGSILSKSARMLGYTRTRHCMWFLSGQVWSIVRVLASSRGSFGED